jgi:ketosteroid isomerase-like protein
VSDRNLELVRRAFAVWQAGQIEEFAPLLHPDFEWDLTHHPQPEFPDTGSGAEAWLRYFEAFNGSWVRYSIEELESFAVGDDVVFVVHENVTPRGTDAPLERTVAVVWRVEDGLLRLFRAFQTRADALASLG